MLATGNSIARRLIHSSCRLACEGKTKEVPTPEEAGYAFNHVERKKGMYKPVHSIAEQVSYMQSRAYAEAYKGLPIYRWYKRNIKGQSKLQPPPRLFCIDKHGRFNLNHACPVCRDEYLYFDYRNPSLIEQFLADGTDQPIDILKSGLCREQYTMLRAQLLKAKEHGTITFGVEFRNFDYRQWYKSWQEEPGKPVERAGVRLQDIHPDPLVHFPTFKNDKNNDWDQWWIRHDKFARKGK
uniref:28S ribosomal protein S18-2, mitochondrial n=1 Tax=Caenorhabditis tropicalis TaxID=1561998 RepID=A0A1I7V150_9PELO